MEDKLQTLTRKIYEEGVLKARAEAAEIRQNAEEEAARLLDNARREAEKIRLKAEKDAESLRNNVLEELRTAARQVMRSVQQQITEFIILKVSDEPLHEIFNDVAFVKNLVEVIVKNWRDNSGLTLTLPREQEKLWSDFIKGTVHSHFLGNLEIRFDQGIDSGFRIGPSDDTYVISFTEKDFRQLFRAHLRPKTDQILFGK